MTDLPGWTHTYSGKVRELYLPDESPEGRAIVARHGDVVLVVASDRISAYDFVLSPGIPGKGIVKTADALPSQEELDAIAAKRTSRRLQTQQPAPATAGATPLTSGTSRSKSAIARAKAEADAKKADADAKKAEADAKKAEADAKNPPAS